MAKKTRRTKQSATVLGGTPKEQKLARKARPFPEIIDEEDWEVREGRYPSYIKRSDSAEKPHIMQVPLGGTSIDRKIRLHEQAHVTWTPPITEEYEEMVSYLYEMDTLNATEDARIIELMNRTSKEWEKLNKETVGLLTPQMQSAFQDGFGRLAAHLRGEKEAKASGKAAPKAPEKMMNLVEAARLIASTRGYAEGKIFDDIATSADLAWVGKEVQQMHKRWIDKPDPTFEDAIHYAEELEQYFYQKQEEIEMANEALAESGLDEMKRYFGSGTEGAQPVWTPPTETKGKTGRTEMGYGVKPKRTNEVGAWGRLTIVYKPLVDKLAAREGRRSRPSDLGAVPRYMHRLVTDQRVFGRRRKKKVFEGTVLMDCSGSMRLTPQMVDEILRRWPAVTVATYNGSGTMGELWIVAHRGRRASPRDLKPPYGGNVVDGPCLDWLCKQRMPRIWISDGGVTGAGVGGGGESSGYHFIVDAAAKMKRGKIKRLGNVQQLLGGSGDEDFYDDL